jgi:glutamate synthase (NADPH/NADH) large chain
MTQGMPEAQGLYDPRWEHDACGVGAVINVSGRRDHQIVQLGKTVLTNLMHRGAAGADDTTGDGAGMLLQIPHELFAAEADRLGFALSRPGHYGVAMVFLQRQPEPRRQCEEILEGTIAQAGLRPLGWRDVPSDNRTLGDLARNSEPVIRQLFIGGEGLQDEELERRLFVARKRAEHRARKQLGPAAADFYIPTMSCRTICYKGMFMARQLFEYYADLADPRVVTALAIVHQRYSTNTFPSWKLAQPFRMVAHNGEINTLSGNRNRIRAQEPLMACPA